MKSKEQREKYRCMSCKKMHFGHPVKLIIKGPAGTREFDICPTCSEEIENGFDAR